VGKAGVGCDKCADARQIGLKRELIRISQIKEEESPHVGWWAPVKCGLHDAVHPTPTQPEVETAISPGVRWIIFHLLLYINSS
jgi:hypothetical protein